MNAIKYFEPANQIRHSTLVKGGVCLVITDGGHVSRYLNDLRSSRRFAF